MAAPELPRDRDPVFQQECRAADALVSGMLVHAGERGLSPPAIAAGALFAIVRYHLGFAPIRAAGPMMRVMWPALKKTIREVVALDTAPPPPARLDS